MGALAIASLAPAHATTASQSSVETLLPPAVSSALATTYSITVTPGQDVPTISAQEAIQAVALEFGVDVSQAEAYSVQFTDPNYGTPLQETTGPVVPFHINRSAWLVEVPNTVHPIFAAEPMADATYIATLYVFVDSATAAYLEAVTIAQ